MKADIARRPMSAVDLVRGSASTSGATKRLARRNASPRESRLSMSGGNNRRIYQDTCTHVPAAVDRSAPGAASIQLVPDHVGVTPAWIRPFFPAPAFGGR